MNLDLAGLQGDGFAVAGEVIGAFALNLDGRELRRGLQDRSGELRQQRLDRLGGRPGVGGLGRTALDVVGVAFLAPAHREAVALATVHHERHRLGGFAECDRQTAGGERIECAGVTDALGVEQSLQHCDRMGRGHADGFVEHDPAVNVAPLTLKLLFLLARAMVTAAVCAVLRGCFLRNIFFCGCT